MAISFNADEILQMAEQIERNGINFYSLAAERLKQYGDVFSQLARQEDAHLAIFAGMRRSLSAAEREATAYDPDNENSFYLQALADRTVFNLDQDPRKLLPFSITLAGVLDVAIGNEKDSIVFYMGMKELVSEKLGGEKINSIISEEFRHIAVLSGIAVKK